MQEQVLMRTEKPTSKLDFNNFLVTQLLPLLIHDNSTIGVVSLDDLAVIAIKTRRKLASFPPYGSSVERRHVKFWESKEIDMIYLRTKFERDR